MAMFLVGLALGCSLNAFILIWIMKSSNRDFNQNLTEWQKQQYSIQLQYRDNMADIATAIRETSSIAQFKTQAFNSGMPGQKPFLPGRTSGESL